MARAKKEHMRASMSGLVFLGVLFGQAVSSGWLFSLLVGWWIRSFELAVGSSRLYYSWVGW